MTLLSRSHLRRPTGRLALTALALLLPFALLAACGGGGSGGDADSDSHAVAGGTVTGEAGVVTVYSGRSESLIGPILERFTDDTGIEVEVRYGETAELAATLLEEGAATPADIFISQDAAALGAVAGAGLFGALPAEVVDRVLPQYADPDGRWVGLSGRARTVVYNTDRMSENELPRSLEEVAEPRFKGRFGVAPLNGSFQAHMAVYRAVEGAEALDELLAGMVANDPQRYPKNGAIVDAVLAGEVDFGLVNHYYLWRALAENPDAPGANFSMPGGGTAGSETGGFVNIAGAGLLSEDAGALELVRYLLGEEAQRYFAEETFEYPLAAGVAPSVELTPLAELAAPDLNFQQVSAELEATLQAIQGSGLIQ